MDNEQQSVLILPDTGTNLVVNEPSPMGIAGILANKVAASYVFQCYQYF